MLLSGRIKDRISIATPKGVIFDAEILDIRRTADSVSCAVRKDGGDDPDVTSGALIYAEVSLPACRSGAADPRQHKAADAAAGVMDAETDAAAGGRIHITGGEGVGRVTRPGLDQPVGEAAINSVPREMIIKELSEVCGLFDHDGDLSVRISVPGGEEIARHTFNPRLGIEGGISIIGTSGVVEPMSEQAILDTIRVELRQKRAEGHSAAFISPGNYGLDFMKETYGVDLDRSVKCSNYIGDTVDMISELGFDSMLLCGHAGKLVKIAGGIMNTHSRNADCRMEIISASAALEGADTGLLLSILGCLTTEEAFALLDAQGLLGAVSARIMRGILSHLNRRAGGKLHIECVMYNKQNGMLAASEGADEMIRNNGDRWNG